MSRPWTEGPWYAGALLEADSDERIVSVGAFDVSDRPVPCHYEDTICEVWDANGNDAVANAHLIAAAPSLYEALDWLLNDPKIRTAIAGNPDYVDRGINAARAALRLANPENSDDNTP